MCPNFTTTIFFCPFDCGTNYWYSQYLQQQHFLFYLKSEKCITYFSHPGVLFMCVCVCVSHSLYRPHTFHLFVGCNVILITSHPFNMHFCNSRSTTVRTFFSTLHRVPCASFLLVSILSCKHLVSVACSVSGSFFGAVLFCLYFMSSSLFDAYQLLCPFYLSLQWFGSKPHHTSHTIQMMMHFYSPRI